MRDILAGKAVVAPIRQIQEVKNAIKTYELYPTLDAFQEKDLLKAHGVMMEALVDEAGRGIEKQLKKFRDLGIIARTGSDKNGLWVINQGKEE